MHVTGTQLQTQEGGEGGQSGSGGSWSTRGTRPTSPVRVGSRVCIQCSHHSCTSWQMGAAANHRDCFV